MKRLIAAALMCALAGAAGAQDKTITGKWSIQIDVMGNGAQFSCDVTQAGKELTGTCSELGPLNGTVDGETYTWGTKGGQSALTFTGNLKDGKLIGTVDVLDYSVKGDFQGTPVK